MQTEFVEEIAVVEKVKGNVCYVRISKSEKCEGCKACAFGSSDSVCVPARKSGDYNVGDKVLVKSFVKKSYLPTLIIYIIPIILTVLTAVIASIFTKNEVYVIVSCAIALAVGLACAFVGEKLFGKNYRAEIVRKIE